MTKVKNLMEDFQGSLESHDHNADHVNCEVQTELSLSKDNSTHEKYEKL
jgi:hypothetical protein